MIYLKLKFQDAGRSPSGKTRRVMVLANNDKPGTSGGLCFGHLQWHASCRCYVFAPHTDPVILDFHAKRFLWSAGCLREIADELDRMMVEWRMKA